MISEIIFKSGGMIMLDYKDIEWFNYVKERGQITNGDYQRINELKQTVSSQELQALTKLNILESQGSKGRGSKYVLKR
jgi:ATP-dependent DNA helicase RecG